MDVVSAKGSITLTLIQLPAKLFGAAAINYTSNPVRVNGNIGRSVQVSLPTTGARGPAITASRNVTFTTTCLAGVARNHSYDCPVTGIKVEHHCTGTYETMTSVCPPPVLTPRCFPPTGGSTQGFDCTVIHHSALNTTGVCTRRQHQDRLLLSSSSGQNALVDLVTMSEFVAEQTVHTFKSVHIGRSAHGVGDRGGRGVAVGGWAARHRSRLRHLVLGSPSSPEASAGRWWR